MDRLKFTMKSSKTCSKSQKSTIKPHEKLSTQPSNSKTIATSRTQIEELKNDEKLQKLTADLAKGLRSLNNHIDELKQLDIKIEKLTDKKIKKK